MVLLPRINEPTQGGRYKKLLVELMSFKDGRHYADKHEFEQIVLGELTPNDICKWMCQKVYGMPDPGADDNPIGRSSSLAYYKKAISSFMPTKTQRWDAIAKTGNPTKSAPVNDLIKAIKAKEASRQAIGSPEAANNETMNNMLRSQQNAALQQQLSQLQAQVEKLNAQVKKLSRTQSRNFEKINASLNQIATSLPAAPVPAPVPVPVVQRITHNKAAEGASNNASLSRNPRTLYILWQEYEVGIAGRKAARLFTSEERGQVKYVYSRRKVAWDVIAVLVGAPGYTVHTAIDKVYDEYGRDEPVTTIINHMRQDRMTGGHPELRVLATI